MRDKKMKIALYARVSKALQQNPENQLLELRKWAVNVNHQVIGEFIDEISSKDTRPQKEEVLKKMRLGECDGVAFWSLDRWGRTASELIFELEEFSKTGKCLISLKEGIDLSTAAGRLMANMLAIMANFERDRIKEITLLGLARAKSQGKILGRHRLICTCGKCRKRTPHAEPIKLTKEKEISLNGGLI
jgi:DNA invertase Pin-like site-specific DNA recombinase